MHAFCVMYTALWRDLGIATHFLPVPLTASALCPAWRLLIFPSRGSAPMKINKEAKFSLFRWFSLSLSACWKLSCCAFVITSPDIYAGKCQWGNKNITDWESRMPLNTLLRELRLNSSIVYRSRVAHFRPRESGCHAWSNNFITFV